MSEDGLPKRQKEDPEESDSIAPYTTIAIGIGLIVAAILVIITAGTPAAGIGFVIGAAACLGWGIPELIKRRKSLPAPVNREKELLSAIRDNHGDITPAEAAMQTSLTIKEADGMLTELANEGHLKVESRDGVISYSLPKRDRQELV